ncbi:MAG: 4Fe-4S binding protein [Chloroflexi bacterium]|nr:4Fe-4S binding protein [Chloroflexota bacterium]
MSTKMDLTDWKTMPIGGAVTEEGNSISYETGGWRALRPVVDMARCTHCMICWVFCPDSAILAQGGRFVGIDLGHCKGCGICAVECPPKAITMVHEGNSKEGL